MRGNGRVYKPKDSRFWWIDYSVPDVPRQRKSSQSTKKKDANKLLRKLLGERDAGKVIGDPNDVTIATLRTLTENRYRAAQRKSVNRMLGAFAHLERVFGADAVALSLTPSRFDAYAARRMKGEKVGDKEIRPVNRATVNYELAVLRRGFTIALKDERIIATMPNFYLPKVKNRRTGFFDDGSCAPNQRVAQALDSVDPIPSVHGVAPR